MQSSWLSLTTDWDAPSVVTSVLATTGFTRVRGWLVQRGTRPKEIPAWKLFSFAVGLFAIVVAVSSSLDTYSEILLFMHMAQHFVLTSAAPSLVVLTDQISAETFMWVFGSFVFLVPAICVTARFLANGRLLDEKTGLERARALAR